MIFILDENFPKAAIPLLEQEGHEGYHISEFSSKGTQDPDIFQVAQQKNAVFLTTDKDFFHTIPLLFKKHHGVVVIALHKPNREKLLERFKWALRWLKQGTIRNQVLLVTDYCFVFPANASRLKRN